MSGTCAFGSTRLWERKKIVTNCLLMACNRSVPLDGVGSGAMVGYNVRVLSVSAKLLIGRRDKKEQ